MVSVWQIAAEIPRDACLAGLGDCRAIKAGRRLPTRMDGSGRSSEDKTETVALRVVGADMIRPADPGRLRVWTPADDGSDQDTTEDLGPHSTLTEVYEKAYKPILIDGQGLHVRTARVYEDALTWWRVLTHDPPLTQLDARVTAGFVAELLRQPGRSWRRPPAHRRRRRW